MGDIHLLQLPIVPSGTVSNVTFDRHPEVDDWWTGEGAIRILPPTRKPPPVTIDFLNRYTQHLRRAAQASAEMIAAGGEEDA